MGDMKKSLKNLIIALTMCVVALLILEMCLAVKNREPENYNDMCEENAKNIILQLESTSLEKFLTSGTNVVNASSYETLEVEPTFSYCYPLIDITSETVIEDAFNIVVLGDSFVWGAYSTNRNEAFINRITEELKGNMKGE